MTRHGSTISSADCLRKLNHAQKVVQLYRSSDAGFTLPMLQQCLHEISIIFWRFLTSHLSCWAENWQTNYSCPGECSHQFWFFYTFVFELGACSVSDKQTNSECSLQFWLAYVFFCFRVKSLYRLTDKQMDRKNLLCGLLRELHSNSVIYMYWRWYNCNWIPNSKPGSAQKGIKWKHHVPRLTPFLV